MKGQIMWTSRICAILVLGALVPCSLAQRPGPKRVPLEANQLAAKNVMGSVVAARDWRVNTSSAVGVSSLSRGDIDDFVMKYLGFTAAEASVCSAMFADLAGDGSYQLIASIDQSGRMFCNQVVVFRKTHTGFKSAMLETWWLDDVSKYVEDLRGNGRKELLVPQSLTFYAGAKCMAAWTRVFRIIDGSLSDVSSEFPNFYSSRLNELRHNLRKNSEYSVCLEIEADKIKRVMGTVPDAGLAKALAWMKSGDANLRLKAVCVLSDIGGPTSLEALRQASQDTDPVVSDAAKMALAQVSPK